MEAQLHLRRICLLVCAFIRLLYSAASRICREAGEGKEKKSMQGDWEMGNVGDDCVVLGWRYNY